MKTNKKFKFASFLLKKNSVFASKLMSSYEHVMMYEQASLKQKALSVIPVERLRDQARANYETYNNTGENLESSSNPQQQQLAFDFDDFLLLELLAWFKNEFFTWTDQPKCVNCQTNQSMRPMGQQGPNHDEIPWMVSRVEVYQ